MYSVPRDIGDGGRYLISCLQRLQLELHVASWNFATRDRSDHAFSFLTKHFFIYICLAISNCSLSFYSIFLPHTRFGAAHSATFPSRCLPHLSRERSRSSAAALWVCNHFIVWVLEIIFILWLSNVFPLTIRQVFSHGPLCRTTFRGELLPHNREYLQPDYQA